jgi:hypothetical protein
MFSAQEYVMVMVRAFFTITFKRLGYKIHQLYHILEKAII